MKLLLSCVILFCGLNAQARGVSIVEPNCAALISKIAGFSFHGCAATYDHKSEGKRDFEIVHARQGGFDSLSIGDGNFGTNLVEFNRDTEVHCPAQDTLLFKTQFESGSITLDQNGKPTITQKSYVIRTITCH